VLFVARPHTSFRSASVMAVLRIRGRWLGVASEQLANGKLGWVRAGAGKVLRETWRIRVDLSEHRGELLHRGTHYATFPLAVGTAAYPTPTGRFGVTDRLSTGGTGSPYGCCALALTGHQPNVPQDWPGGDRIAIHGTNEPASVGTAASHGCLRASEETMRMLIAKVPLGTQVVIRA
jgi:lipoprotein-anchoring transpeptidase ErfK/SrfK